MRPRMRRKMLKKSTQDQELCEREEEEEKDKGISEEYGAEIGTRRER